MTFLGAAIDLPDKDKTRDRMIHTFSNVVAGEIKNVHTKKDWVLAALYTTCEFDWAMGRNAVFEKHFIDGRRVNLLAEQDYYEGELRAIAEEGQKVIRLRNHDIYDLNSNWWFTGIGHTSYRDNMDLILQHIGHRQ